MTTSSATVAVVAARPATQRGGVGRAAARLSLGKMCAAHGAAASSGRRHFGDDDDNSVDDDAHYCHPLRNGDDNNVSPLFKSRCRSVYCTQASYILINNLCFSCWAHKALFL